MKVLKWVVIVVAVILVTALILAYTPYMLPGWLGNATGSLLGFLGKIGASAFGSGLAGMIGVEIGATAGSIITATLAGVSAIALSFARQQKVELQGQARKQWEVARFVLSSVLNNPKFRCYSFLKSKGFDPDTIAKDLETQKLYDGFLSTNVEDFGALGASPKEFFGTPKANNIPTDAATARSGNIYYGDARGGISASLVLHENLHKQLPSLSDDALGRKLGTWKTIRNPDGTYKDTAAINKTLEMNGCK